MIFLVISEILSENQIEVIGKFLKESNKLGTYVLCWKSSHTDTNRNGFFESCGDKKDTISIFRTGSKKHFGGFTDMAWGGG